jgi:putative ABC transport system permease protein
MYLQTLLISVAEIRRNAMRSFLTVLGIIIGVAAVIVMSTLGEGATAKVTADIAKLGSNMLVVRPGQHRGPGSSEGAEPFTLEDADAIRRSVAGLEGVAPSASKGTTVVSGNENWATTVLGTTNEYLAVRDWAIAEGRAFSMPELHAGRFVCIIGQTVRREVFGSQSPVGRQVRLGRQPCEVVGLLEAKGTSGFGADQDDIVIVPLAAFQQRIAGNRDVSRIYLSATDASATERALTDVTTLMKERRRIGPAEADDFSVTDMKEITSAMTGATEVMTTLLSSVAAVSLLVGGIGIMNIMLVSVTERTREIGIRLAIGAREHEVLLQFLMEAVVLSTLGGLVGIVLAVFGSMGLTSALGLPYVLSPGMVALAFVFSAAVGVIFGFLPARKAARLNPIEALRHE